MKHIAIGIFAAALMTAPALADESGTPAFNSDGARMGHWHLNSKDVEANKKIFVAMGGIAIKPGDFEIVKFPGVAVLLHLRPGVAPSLGGTDGTVINHVGFLVPNVVAAVDKWKAAGVPVELGKDRTDQAWVTTADGLRVEILEDKAQTVPVKHHHVHYFLAESVIPDAQAWYVKNFGAVAGMRGKFKAVDIPAANLTFTPTDKQLLPTSGRVLDHIGFDVKSMDETVKRLEANGIKLDRPVVTNPAGKLTFIHDPWGASIELNERNNPL